MFVRKRLLIKEGKVVNDDAQFDVDVFIEGEKIKQMGLSLVILRNTKIIDAKGKWIIPGFCILIGLNYSLVHASDLDNQTCPPDGKDNFLSDLDDPEFAKLLETDEYLRNFYDIDYAEQPLDMMADPSYIQYLKNLTKQMQKFQPPIPPGMEVKWPKVLIDPEGGGKIDMTKPSWVNITYIPGTMFPGSRPAPLTEAEQKKFLEYHLKYRWNYTFPSADTEYMVHNDLLAQYSLAIASLCLYDEVFPPDLRNWFPQRVGQNLYVGPTPDPARAMWLWYMEILNMNFIQWHCYGPECGHLNQMQNAKSREIGCNRHLCWPKKGTENERYLTVCHYYLPGNLFSADGTPVRGFTIGKQCSLCNMEYGGWCWFNQSTCVRKSDIVKYRLKDVTCPLKCRNCGVLNEDTCTCKCKAGWDGLDCSNPCTNFASFCPLLKADQCGRDDLLVKEFLCREKCGTCGSPNNTLYKDMDCCPGVECQKDYEANASNFCECELRCPSLTCYEENDVMGPAEDSSMKKKSDPYRNRRFSRHHVCIFLCVYSIQIYCI